MNLTEWSEKAEMDIVAAVSLLNESGMYEEAQYMQNALIEFSRAIANSNPEWEQIEFTTALGFFSPETAHELAQQAFRETTNLGIRDGNVGAHEQALDFSRRARELLASNPNIWGKKGPDDD